MGDEESSGPSEFALGLILEATHSEEGKREAIRKAMPGLSENDISSFIHHCFKMGDAPLARIMAEEAVRGAIQAPEGKALEQAEYAVRTLLVRAGQEEFANALVDQLLDDENPAVVAIGVRMMHPNMDVSNVLRVKGKLFGEFEAARTTIEYIERCVRSAAFMNRRGEAVDIQAEEFLRGVVESLEEEYPEIRKRAEAHVEKRVCILLAMIYNELLKFRENVQLMGEELDEEAYDDYEWKLERDIGDRAIPQLCKMLTKTRVDRETGEEELIAGPGVEEAGLKTLGRLSNCSPYTERILRWLEDEYIIRKPKPMESRLELAHKIIDARRAGQKFRSSPPPPKVRQSIAPRGPLPKQVK